MKKYSFFIIIALFFSIGCNQDKENTSKIENVKTIESPSLMLSSTSPTDESGFIVMELHEYTDIQYNTKPNPNFVSGFIGEDKKYFDAGTVAIQNKTLTRKSDNRYFSNSSFQVDDYLGKNVAVRFDSQIAELSSFEQQAYVSNPMNVKTNLGNDEFFSKSKDIELTWIPDNHFTKVYISVCVPGSPCIIKELPDSGSAKIAKEEISNFPNGKPLVVVIGRGEITSLVNQGKNINIKSYVYAISSEYKLIN
jgi:hypothetical protein